MSDKLLARLRAPRHPNIPDMQEAADEITRLRADLAATREERDAYRNTANGWECVCRNAEARMSKLDFERTAAELRAEAAEADLSAAREALKPFALLIDAGEVAGVFYVKELRKAHEVCARIDAALGGSNEAPKDH